MSESYKFFTVVLNRRMLAEFDFAVEAEQFAAGVAGSKVVVMVVPGRES